MWGSIKLWWKSLKSTQFMVPLLIVAAVVTVVFVLFPVGNPYQSSGFLVDRSKIVDEGEGVRGEESGAGTQGMTQASTASAVATTPSSFSLNSNERINALVENYYEALVAGSDERLARYTDNVSGISDDYRRIFAVYVDDVDDLDCYTMAGLLSDTYIVVAVSELAYKGFDQRLPNVDYLYVCTDASGNLYVSNSEPADDVSSYNELMYRNVAMTQIVSGYVERYDEKLKENPELAAFVSGFRQDVESFDDEMIGDGSEGRDQD